MSRCCWRPPRAPGPLAALPGSTPGTGGDPRGRASAFWGWSRAGSHPLPSPLRKERPTAGSRRPRPGGSDAPWSWTQDHHADATAACSLLAHLGHGREAHMMSACGMEGPPTCRNATPVQPSDVGAREPGRSVLEPLKSLGFPAAGRMNAIPWQTVPLRSLGDAVATRGACQAVAKRPGTRPLPACPATGMGPGARLARCSCAIHRPPASEASVVLRLTLK